MIKVLIVATSAAITVCASQTARPRIVNMRIGQIVAIVSGDGECFQAVGAYLKSLAN